MYTTVLPVTSPLRLEHLQGEVDFENVTVSGVDPCHPWNILPGQECGLKP